MKKIVLFIGCFLLGLLLLFGLFFRPTRSSSDPSQPYYPSTVLRLDSVLAAMPVVQDDTLYAGWARQNITPEQPTKLMGYGWKGNFERVRDSLWVRSFVFRSGSLSVALVSYDLMLTPPTVARAVKQRLAKLGLPHIYFTAIHTHHGFGEWQPGPAGAFITGGYDAALVETLVDQTVASVQQAQRRLQPVQMSYARYNQSQLVGNRLVDGGGTDPYLRVIRFQPSAGGAAVLASFAAHATFLPSRFKELSADYPGEVVQQLEEQPAIDFALLAAGAVGSHGPFRSEGDTLTGYARQLILPMLGGQDTTVIPQPMSFAEVPLELDEPQLRLFAGWQVRPWLFRWFFGDVQPVITFFRLGRVVLVGVPADFSGMLYPSLQTEGLDVMVTSFNGDYIGYVIPDQYYHLPHREARETNWYGPHTGSYTVALINRGLAGLMKTDARIHTEPPATPLPHFTP